LLASKQANITGMDIESFDLGGRT